MTQLWTQTAASPRGIVRFAQAAEEAGWAGVGVVDSQNLSGDPFVTLAMAANATERLRVATAVSNPVTRMPAALATAIASVDRVAGGRATLGIGRGDSALAHLGRSPAKVAHFETYLKYLQAYLRGEPVAFDEIDIPDAIAKPIGALDLASAPTESRIGWLADVPKTPIEVAASGPRVIGLAAVHAERVMFALGADPVRISWGMDVAREARRKAGLDPDGVAFGAYVNAACHPDIDVARDIVRGGLTTFARFSVMHGKTVGPLSDEMAEAMLTLRAAYDMRKHTQGDSAQAATLTPDFIDAYAIVGTPDAVLRRLQGLAALGLDKIAVSGNLRPPSAEAGYVAKALMEREVVPAFVEA